jgi:hypothetical protein
MIRSLAVMARSRNSWLTLHRLDGHRQPFILRNIERSRPQSLCKNYILWKPADHDHASRVT